MTPLERRRDIERRKKQKWRNKNRAKVRADHAAWKKANPGIDAFHSAKRRAAKLQATPSWYEEKQVKGLYQFASWLSKEYGKAIHVDHIIPLQGKNVSGLHCIDNLQLLFAEDNLKKSNTHSIAS